MVSLLVAALFPQDDPLARNETFMKSAKGLSLEYTVREPQLPAPAKASLSLLRPLNQRYVCSWVGEEFTFVQNKDETFFLRDDLKQYQQGPAFPTIVMPSPLAGFAEYAYPDFVLVPSLVQFEPLAPRKALPKETVRGLECDVVEIVSNNSSSFPGTHRFWIDAEGRVQRWHRHVELQTGTIDTTMDFTKIESTAPADPAHYRRVLKTGYMPASLMGPKNVTRAVSERAVFGTWTDARTGEKADVAALAKGTAVAIVFTAPDCPISTGAEPFLVALRRQLKAKGCALIEVSLGASKPDARRKDKDRRLFHDADGEIDRAYNVPGTPYFLVADANGTLVSGWQGYTKPLEAEILKALLAPFEKR
jgi:hypothetical protein